jgi:hypothetical protein
MASRRRIGSAVGEYIRSHGFDPTEAFCVDLPNEEKVTVLGEIQWVEYVTRKKFEGDEYFIFHHDFEGDKKPYLARGKSRYFVIGGGYTVTPHGIEDDDKDPRTLPTGKSFRLNLRCPPTLTGMGDMKSFGIVTHSGEEQTVGFDKGQEKQILAYNHDRAAKQLWLVPTQGSRREAL